MSYMFRLCASLKMEECPESSPCCNRFGEACLFGEVDVVQEFLETREVTSLPVIQCGLRRALWEFGQDCQPVLLDAGARMGLVEVTQSGNIQMLQQMAHQGISLNGEAGDFPPIVVACAQAWSDADVIRFLLDAGVNVNAVDPLGDTALIHAVEWEKKGIVGWLLDTGQMQMSCHEEVRLR
jgi:hypothetical protein